MSEDFREDWTGEMEKEEVAIRDASPVIACMFRELRGQGLGTEDAAPVAMRWWSYTVEDDRQLGEED